MKNWPTRPTTDFAREALFNVLSNTFDFSTIKMLDLFGGTGAHTLEAVSRGCMDIVYVEQYQKCHQFLKSIIKDWEIAAEVDCVRSECKSFLLKTSRKFDYIFADPPYQQKKWSILPSLIFELQLLKDEGWLVVEHMNHTDFSSDLNFVQQRNYGQTRFSFFQNKS
jgi:16S rRNA (guanine(966)-N(2))-methyltransferase RsmD